MELPRINIISTFPGLGIEGEFHPDNYTLKSPSGDWNIRWLDWQLSPTSCRVFGKWLALPMPQFLEDPEWRLFPKGRPIIYSSLPGNCSIVRDLRGDLPFFVSDLSQVTPYSITPKDILNKVKDEGEDILLVTISNYDWAKWEQALLKEMNWMPDNSKDTAAMMHYMPFWESEWWREALKVQ